ncbi:FGGY-family carbohydrate kinase [Hungatella hathewayi]|uniref:FGGY-family carbohydrate kinase n=1 Tax=Hungatella hathewayi TaxID=154046 RepID=UPI0009B6BB25
MQGELTLHNDSSLRASYVGSSSRHTTEHFTRATLEGIAFSNDYYKMKSNAASYFRP